MPERHGWWRSQPAHFSLNDDGALPAEASASASVSPAYGAQPSPTKAGELDVIEALQMPDGVDFAMTGMDGVDGVEGLEIIQEGMQILGEIRGAARASGNEMHSSSAKRIDETTSHVRT